ncbi:MAG: hypothetical protein ABFC12_06740, partial [Methanobacterium sp.]
SKVEFIGSTSVTPIPPKFMKVIWLLYLSVNIWTYIKINIMSGKRDGVYNMDYKKLRIFAGEYK